MKKLLVVFLLFLFVSCAANGKKAVVVYVDIENEFSDLRLVEGDEGFVYYDGVLNLGDILRVKYDEDRNAELVK